MLNINTAFTQNKKQSRISFGTNLIVGQGVVDHLNKNPQDLQKIQEFKDYLAKDGKNWSAELTYDKYEPTQEDEVQIEALIKKDANNYDWKSKGLAEKKVAQMDSKKASDLLEKLLTNKNDDVNATAADMIGYIKDAKIAAVLMEKTAKSENPEVKRNAISSMSNIQDSKILAEMIEKYVQDPNPEIRRDVASSAGHIKDETLRNSMIEKLSNNPDAKVRLGVADTLNLIEDQKVFDKLLEKLAADENIKVRTNAISQLCNLDEDKIKLNSALYDKIIENSSRETEQYAKSTAASIAGKHSSPQKAAELIEGYITSEDEYTRRNAARSAGYIQDQKVAANLIEKLIINPDKAVRDGAVDSVGKLKDKTIQTYFIEKLANSKDPEVRKWISWNISNLEKPEKQASIIEKLLSDEAPGVRNYAAINIGCISDTKIRDGLIDKYIKSYDLDVKSGISEALDRLLEKNSEKVKEFAQILAKDSDKSIQKGANEILDVIKVDEQKDGYRVKITDGDKVVGSKKVKDGSNIFDSFFETYKAIFEKNAN